MKFKRTAAILMVLMLAISLAPMQLAAAATCSHSNRTSTAHPADWNMTTGGYVYDYYICTDCQAAVNENGDAHQFVDAQNKPDPNSDAIASGHPTHPEEWALSTSGHLPNPDTKADAAPSCVEGYREENYACYSQVCQARNIRVDADGNLLSLASASAAHTPDEDNRQEANELYDETWYKCSGCQAAVDANGNALTPNNSGSGGDGSGDNDGPCQTHEPDRSQKYTADYAVCCGGYQVDWYPCKNCCLAVDENGNEVEYFEATEPHSPMADSLQEANYSDCGGGFQTSFYVCERCHQPTNADGTNPTWSEPTANHTLVKKLAKDTTPNSCAGWSDVDYYACSVCQNTFIENEAGEYEYHNLQYPENYETALHTAGNTVVHEKKSAPCSHGFNEDVYECVHCGLWVFKNGTMATESAGNGKHSPGQDEQPANYTDCGGGIKTPFYVCTLCYQPCTKDGADVEGSEPITAHTLVKKLAEDTTPNSCAGWSDVDYYACSVCQNAFIKNEAGEYEYHNLQYPENYETALHTAGDTVVHEKKSVPCSWGYDEDVYECVHCGLWVFKNGTMATESAGNGEHHPGQDEQPPDYTLCGGGIKTSFYICTLCDQPCTKEGADPEWSEGDYESHRSIIYLPRTEPSYWEIGLKAHYECPDCGTASLDAAGETTIDWEDLIIPILESPKEDTLAVLKEQLEEVPEGLPEEIETVDDVWEALAETLITKFENDEELLEKLMADDVFDLTLQQYVEGEWIDVSPENFPEEGVEVLLPYPYGTNKDSHEFFILHMICHGENSGKVEILPYEAKDNGLLVRFSSFSPVMIAYAEADAPEAPVPSPSTGTTPTTVPATGDDRPIALYVALLVLSGTALLPMIFKRKA